jgi:hypothetical protein
MAIHYIGRLAPVPGKRACPDPTAGAESYDLHATDCGDCRTSLIGAVIRHAEPGSIPATIAEVRDHEVALSMFGADRVWMPWHKIDIPNPWMRVR